MLTGTLRVLHASWQQKPGQRSVALTVFKCKLGQVCVFHSMALEWSSPSFSTGRRANCTPETRSRPASTHAKSSITRTNGLSDIAMACFWLPFLYFPTHHCECRESGPFVIVHSYFIKLLFITGKVWVGAKWEATKKRPWYVVVLLLYGAL